MNIDYSSEWGELDDLWATLHLGYLCLAVVPDMDYNEAAKNSTWLHYRVAGLGSESPWGRSFLEARYTPFWYGEEY